MQLHRRFDSENRILLDQQALHDRGAERESAEEGAQLSNFPSISSYKAGEQLVIDTHVLSDGHLQYTERDGHLQYTGRDGHLHIERLLPDLHVISLPSSEYAGSSHEDHLLLHHVLAGAQPEPTISNLSARLLLTASASSQLSGRSFCSGGTTLCSPPRPTAAAAVPSRVCALRRHIVTTGNKMKGESPVHDNSIHNFGSDEVCLELNIGRGGCLHVGSRKTLQDIHSEEKSGFSKWKRPEQQESSGSGITQSMSNVAAETPSPEKAEVDNIAAMHAIPASSLGLHLGNGFTTTVEDPINPPDPSTYLNAGSNLVDASSPSPAVAGCSVRTMSWAPNPSVGEALWPDVHPHGSLSTGELLQAAFPTELSPAKRQKLISHEHQMPTSSRAISIMDESFYHHQVLSTISRQIISHSSRNSRDRNGGHNGTGKVLAKINEDHMAFQGLSTHRTLKPIEVPSVQEKCLVEFLHAKKQQQDHFLDKVIVKGDVYQSHPWNFAGGKGIPQFKGL